MRTSTRLGRLTSPALAIGVALAVSPLRAEAPANVLLISIDTLRADRLSSYGYSRQTSPHLDALFRRGVRFTEARTVETLTAPALASMLLSLAPHEHGSTRNGLRVRPDLPSLPKILRREGYRASAFVGSWTLRDRLWGMADHFDHFEAVLTRARWLGLFTREAKADDLNERAVQWLERHLEERPERPFFLWVHYVEPHAPYTLQHDFLAQIGPAPGGDPKSRSNRYDSEIAYVDHRVAQLLEAVAVHTALDDILLLVVADHGESLGEHGYWGHGRHLYEPTLKIPMAIVWPGRLAPGTVDAPALISDLPRTILGLLGFEVPGFLQGLDWSGVLAGPTAAPYDRITFYQAHRGAVTPKEDQARVRQRGLLEIARLEGSRKEIYRLNNARRWVFNLAVDAEELDSLQPLGSDLSESLRGWLETVQEGLVRSDELPPAALDEEDLEALRALGYLD